MEVNKILPLLIDSEGEGPSFHVIAPSLPGFGFSEAPRKQGFSGAQFAETFNKLMLSLGYEEYGVFSSYLIGSHILTHLHDSQLHKVVIGALTIFNVLSVNECLRAEGDIQ